MIKTKENSMIVGLDVGGTHTDVVLLGNEGLLKEIKVLTDSSSDRGSHILAIHIPRKACRDCKGLGYKWYDTADAREYDMIFLQDRTEDKYLTNN